MRQSSDILYDSSNAVGGFFLCYKKTAKAFKKVSGYF